MLKKCGIALCLVAVVWLASGAIRQAATYVAGVWADSHHASYDPGSLKPSTWTMRSGAGDRIYLERGAIYAELDDPANEYNIVHRVLHVTREEYVRLVFFPSPEAAEANGFKPSREYLEYKKLAEKTASKKADRSREVFH